MLELANKAFNLYLPIAYTYISYHAPILSRLASYIVESSAFQSLKKAITEKMSASGTTDCCDKKTDKPNATDDQKGDSVIATGHQVIKNVVDKTITGQVLKRLVGINRKRTGDGSQIIEESVETSEPQE